MKVKVDELQASLLSSPLPQPLRRPVQGGQVTIYKRDCLLVRARANQGQVGYGVGTPSPNVAQLINRNLRAAVVGLNPANLAGLRRKVFQRRPRYPGLVQAFAAVEMALLDLQGRIAGCPLSELLGGRVRGRVRIHASGGVYLDGEEIVREAGLWAGSGFSACKLELGRSPRQDLQTVRELREAFPAPWGIMVDARAWRGGHYGLEETARLLREMAPSRLEWVEEPVAPNDRGALRPLLKDCRVPLSWGGGESSLEGGLDLARLDRPNLLQLDVLHLGGLIDGQRALREVQPLGRRVAIGRLSTPLEAAALAQLASCFGVDLVGWMEWPQYSGEGRSGTYPFRLAEQMLHTPLWIDKGEVIVPESPGLGVKVNESVIRRFPFRTGPCSSFQPAGP
ncbi:MAG: hypothetical protein F4Z21_04735 [Acidobacteria bacterium]|nr:hypothetical protein [Acidobacteriota bacterium]